MIRLFVGVDGTNCDLESQMVLEYSLRQHASQPVEITWMQQTAKGPYSGWRCGSGRTPFSHFRWSIPAMCNFEGKAIYTDSDFIFMADIAELWNQPVPGVFLAKVGKKGLHKTCCMLFDCAKAKGHVPGLDKLKAMPDPQGTFAGKAGYFRKQHPELATAFEGDWNALDAEGYADIHDPRIKAIHYTRMEHQVHLKYAQARLKKEGKTHWYTGPTMEHPNRQLADLFDRLYAEALAAGYTVEQYRVDPFTGATRRNFTYSHSRVG